MRIGFEHSRGDRGVLLLHGLSGTPGEVEPLGDHLASKGVSSMGPWLVGHGSSPKDLAATRWQDWAGSAVEAFEEARRRWREVFVGGLSMGGLQALHLASHFPVEGVLSLSAPVCIFDFRFNGIAFFKFLQWRTSNLTGGILDPSAPPHITYPYVATRSLHELKKFMDHVREDLPYVRVPALVVQGRKDSMVPPENGGIIHRALGSQVKHLLYLDRSDHVVTMDHDRQTLFEKAFRFIETGGKGIDRQG
jgi:carboxylesterase